MPTPTRIKPIWETEEQARMATDADCDILQGFYFYRPVDVVALEKLFAENDKV